VVTDATAEIDPELLTARVVHTTDVNGGAETTRYVCGVESVCAEVRAWMLSLTAER
jgi:hypothetical protein